MSRYTMLVRVLDQIRNESRSTPFSANYIVDSDNIEHTWQARSRAYIHLYLKVMFGIGDFATREALVTDGGGDGGVDGYYVDRDRRLIYLIQSKFRITQENFENKPIGINELLSMEVRKIVSGDDMSANGQPFNDKIKQLQASISDIPDIGRYKYRVIILANAKISNTDALRKLTDGYLAEIFDFSRTYSDLLFPVLSGTLFKATGLNISLDLSNKSAGAKISYEVRIGEFDCDITVVFVPTIEIARIMARYKNSILLFNPRSYLEFEGEKVNAAIRASVLEAEGNEFAVLNNGITIICDESGVNEHSGRKNRAQLFLLNPQIINGGQTAYTLSRIFEQLTEEERARAFAGKEVLVKAIALGSTSAGDTDAARKSILIERISMATNSQTVVTHADRASGDPLQIALQREIYERHGLLFERKRGEFSEALREKLIKSSDIVPRTLVPRLILALAGSLRKAAQKRMGGVNLEHILHSSRSEDLLFAYQAFTSFANGKNVHGRTSFAHLLPQVYASKVVAERMGGTSKVNGQDMADLIKRHWGGFQNDFHKKSVATNNHLTASKRALKMLAPIKNEIDAYFSNIPLQDANKEIDV